MRAQLFDADGAAVVIHSGADDYRSQPSGAAGPRIACGVIVEQVE
jgi:Cu-Zn family superoxide dismutase